MADRYTYGLGALQLCTVHEIAYSSHGDAYWVWDTIMPRIQDEILDCVIYLYFSSDAAEKGEAAGGSGFLVSVPSEVHQHIGHIYAVTNSHVVRGGATVVRFNTQKEDIAVFALDEQNWAHHPDGDDLAVHYLGPWFPPKFKGDYPLIVGTTRAVATTTSALRG